MTVLATSNVWVVLVTTLPVSAVFGWFAVILALPQSVLSIVTGVSCGKSSPLPKDEASHAGAGLRS